MDTQLRMARRGTAVTPSDQNVLARPARKGLYVGGAGNVVVIDDTGSPVTFTNVPAGTLLPIIVTRVNATNTTATNLVALS